MQRTSVKLAAAILIDGVIIVAVGLTLVFGVLNILNFAHQFAVGAYAAASAVGWYYGGDVLRISFDARRRNGTSPCTSSRFGGSVR